MATEIQAIEQLIRTQTKQQQKFIESVSVMLTNSNSKFKAIEDNLVDVQKDIKDIKENEELENEKYNRLNKQKTIKVESAVLNSNESIRQELYKQITSAIKKKFNLTSLPTIKKKDEEECEKFIEDFKFNYNNAAICKCRKIIKEIDKIIDLKLINKAKYHFYDYKQCLKLMDKSYREEYENNYKFIELQSFIKNNGN